MGKAFDLNKLKFYNENIVYNYWLFRAAQNKQL